MTLLRRRPREVYRVYSEEEYLNGAGSDIASVGGERPLGEFPLGEIPLSEPPFGELPLPVEIVGHRAGEEHRPRGGVQERRLHRMAGVAMLAAAVGTVGGVVFLNVARAHSDAEGPEGSLIASTHSPRVVRPPLVAGARPSFSESAVVRSAKRTRLLPAPVARGSGSASHLFSTHSPNHLLTHIPTHPRAWDVVVADYVPRPSQLQAVAVDAPAQQSATSATGESTAADAAADAAVVRPAQSSAAERRSEFGFER
jgi:hypothetical protein